MTREASFIISRRFILNLIFKEVEPWASLVPCPGNVRWILNFHNDPQYLRVVSAQKLGSQREEFLGSLEVCEVPGTDLSAH
jgi:hypothetical protein